MQSNISYKELEISRNAIVRVCNDLQTDKAHLNSLIEFMKQENQQLRQKIKDLECINNYLKIQSKEEVSNVITEVLDDYHFNFNN